MATVKRSRTKNNFEGSEAKPSKSASPVASVKTRSVDIQEVIRERAYELYQQRGGHHGADLEDWVRAEKEILERFRGNAA